MLVVPFFRFSEIRMTTAARRLDWAKASTYSTSVGLAIFFCLQVSHGNRFFLTIVFHGSLVVEIIAP